MRRLMLLPLFLAALIAAAAVRTASRPSRRTQPSPAAVPAPPPAPPAARSLPPTTCAAGHACAQAEAPSPRRSHWFQRAELRGDGGQVLWRGRWTRTAADATAEMHLQDWPDGASAAHVGRRFHS